MIQSLTPPVEVWRWEPGVSRVATLIAFRPLLHLTQVPSGRRESAALPPAILQTFMLLWMWSTGTKRFTRFLESWLGSATSGRGRQWATSSVGTTGPH